MCQAIILGDVYLTVFLFCFWQKEHKIIQADRKSTEWWVSDVFINFQSASFVSPPFLSPYYSFVFYTDIVFSQPSLSIVNSTNHWLFWIISLHCGQPCERGPLEALRRQLPEAWKCRGKWSFISFRLIYKDTYRHWWNAKWFHFHLLLSWRPHTGPVGYLTC